MLADPGRVSRPQAGAAWGVAAGLPPVDDRKDAGSPPPAGGTPAR